MPANDRQSEEAKGSKAARTRNLLLSGLDTSGKNKKGRKGPEEELDMEITFTPALSASKPVPAQKTGQDGTAPDDVPAALSSSKAALAVTASDGGAEKQETTREKYLRKQREKREARMAKLVEARVAKESQPKDKSESEWEESEELPASLAGGDEGGAGAGAERLGHFSMQDIVRAEKDKSKAGKLRGKAKKKAASRAEKTLDQAERKIQPGFTVNPEDDRFAALYTDHQFALDPSHAAFRKTQAMQTLLSTTDKKRHRQGDEEPEQEEAKAQSAGGNADPGALVQRLKQRAASGGVGPRPRKMQKQTS